MRKIMFLLSVFALPCVSPAQSNSDWPNLSRLHPGQPIQIVETNSKKHSGTFESVSDTAISYRETAGEHSLEKQDVRSVKLMENHHRLRNTLIGTGVGAGVGAAIGAATYRDSCTTNSFCFNIGGRALPTGIGAVVGGVGGAVVGVLLPSHSTMYNATPH
jgi:hypothetical protein